MPSPHHDRRTTLLITALIATATSTGCDRPNPPAPTPPPNTTPAPQNTPPPSPTVLPEEERVEPKPATVPPEPTAPADATAPSPSVAPPALINQNAPAFTGAVELVDSPTSVRAGALTSTHKARLVIERESTEISAALKCDATTPSMVRAGAAGTPGQIDAGKKVRSYLLHADTAGDKATHFEGTITFHEPIMGLMISKESLDASDGPLGREGVSYPTGGKWRAWFDGSTDDWLSISADRRTLSFRSSTAQWIDQVRIVTESP